MSRLIVEAANGDSYFTGNLKQGIALAARDRWISSTYNDGVWRVELCDDPERTDAAEWGSSITSEEEAMRYALGAMFGPDDAEYDNERLHAWLQIAEHITPKEEA